MGLSPITNLNGIHKHNTHTPHLLSLHYQYPVLTSQTKKETEETIQKKMKISKGG